MDSNILFTADSIREYPIDMTDPTDSTYNVDVIDKSKASTRTGIIKNLYADKYQVEKETKGLTPHAGVQSKRLPLSLRGQQTTQS